jgi:hypothetical protein
MQPLMEKIQQLQATPKKELSDLQLIWTFTERRIQPLAERAHCMWDGITPIVKTRLEFLPTS